MLAGAHDPEDHHPWLGGRVRVGAACAPVLRRGDDTFVPGPHAVPARRSGDRAVLRDVLAPPPRSQLHDAALPACDRAVARHADHALPVTARLPRLPRLRPAHPAGARGRRPGRAGRGYPAAGARRRERRRARDDRAGAHDPLFGPVVRSARRLGLDVYSEDFRRLLRHGRAVDVTRLEQEIGHRPRYTTEAAVRDWVRCRRERHTSAA